MSKKSKKQDFSREYLCCNGQVICKESEWHTPDTYDNNFKMPPSSSGIYLLVAVFDRYLSKEVVYIGSSKNLLSRYETHDVRRKIEHLYDFIQFYFKTTDDYLKEEKELIFKFNPKFNIQHRNIYEQKTQFPILPR